MKKYISVLVCLVVSTFLAIPTPARACSEILLTPGQSYELSDAVFTGKLINVSFGSDADYNYSSATISVTKVWKGHVGRTVRVVSVVPRAFACQPAFNVSVRKGEYLIYVDSVTAHPETYVVLETQPKYVPFVQAEEFDLLDFLASLTGLVGEN